jgi:hypothetical protein
LRIFRRTSARQELAAIIILISAMTISNFLYYFLLDDIFTEQLSSPLGVVLFVMLVVLSYGAGHYILLHTLSQTDRDIGNKSRFFRLVYNAVRIAFYATAVIVTLIIVQIALTSQYYVGMSVAVMAISFLLGSGTYVLLSYKFFMWYSSMHNGTTLLYGVAFAITLVGAGMLVIVNLAVTLENPGQIESFPPVTDDDNDTSYYTERKSPELFNLFQIVNTPIRMAFVLFWIATVLLLHNYSKTIGRMKFWLIISLPMASFLLGVGFSLTMFEEGLLDAIIFPSAASAGGVLFGIVFLTLSRSIRQIQQNTVAHYLTIAGYGAVLAYASVTSNMPIIDRLHTPFPPFATVPWAFAGFATYLISSGFYFSAISISQDIKLRKSVRQLGAKGSKLLDNIGSAQMEQEIKETVLTIAKEQEETLKQQTGVEQTMSDEDIQLYVAEVMKELKKAKAK